MASGTYPTGIFIPFLSAKSPSFSSGYPFRGVLHTTQSTDYSPSQTSYYGHHNPPHFTVARKSASAKIYQHYSISNGSRALGNKKGGVETNRACAIQIEIAWKAENINNLPSVLTEALRDLMRWIEMNTGIERKSIDFFEEKDAYGSGNKSRMSFQEWKNFDGWCGHQHVPENLHWDPGPIDISSLLK